MCCSKQILDYNLASFTLPDSRLEYLFQKFQLEYCQKLYNFDIISYIDFAIAVYEDYKALTGLRKNLYDYRANYKNFLDEDKESDTNLYSFHINISQNFKTINVQVKNNMNKFNYCNENGRTCIMLPFRKSNNFNLYGWYQDFQKDSLMFLNGKYYSNNNIQCPDWLRKIFVIFQSVPTQIKN